MTQKKSFKTNPATQFISAAEDPEEAPPQPEAPQEAPQAPQDGFSVPKGYRLAPEFKSERVQLLIRPVLKEVVKRAAAERGISMNEFICQLIEEYAERQESQ